MLVMIMFTLSSCRMSDRCPKQYWSCKAHLFKRASNKISISEIYGRMPSAGVDMTECSLVQNGRQTGKGYGRGNDSNHSAYVVLNDSS